MPSLSPKERKVLNVLYAALRPLNTNQISDRADMSWQTTKKYLERLYGKEYLRRKKKGNATYWRLR